MVSRFMQIKDCVISALSDLNASDMWDEQNCRFLHELMESLEPIKFAVDALSRDDATLITSEAIFEVLLNKLTSINKPISRKLLTAVKSRILQRRNVPLVTLILYLQNPDNLSKHNILNLSPKTEAIKMAVSLMTRLFPEVNVEEQEQGRHSDVSSDGDDIETVTFQNLLQKSIDNISKSPELAKVTMTSLRSEFRTFDCTYQKTDNLNLLFNALKTIKPTSICCERVFSKSGTIISKLRCRLSDSSVNVISFLNSFFVRSKR